MNITNIKKTNEEKTKSGNSIWRLLSEEIGVPNFELRYFEIPVRGQTSYGKHPWEHEVYIIKGRGVVKGKTLNGKSYKKKVQVEDAIYIACNEEHQFLNNGDKPFGFICVCPKGYE